MTDSESKLSLGYLPFKIIGLQDTLNVTLKRALNIV